MIKMFLLPGTGAFGTVRSPMPFSLSLSADIRSFEETKESELQCSGNDLERIAE